MKSSAQYVIRGGAGYVRKSTNALGFAPSSFERATRYKTYAGAQKFIESDWARRKGLSIESVVPEAKVFVAYDARIGDVINWNRRDHEVADTHSSGVDLHLVADLSPQTFPVGYEQLARDEAYYVSKNEGTPVGSPAAEKAAVLARMAVKMDAVREESAAIEAEGTCPVCGLIEGCHTSGCPRDPDVPAKAAEAAKDLPVVEFLFMDNYGDSLYIVRAINWEIAIETLAARHGMSIEYVATNFRVKAMAEIPRVMSYGSAEPREWAVVEGEQIIDRMLTITDAGKVLVKAVADGRSDAMIVADSFVCGGAA